MPKLSAPWLPFFGTGAPGAAVPHNAMYFDKSTTPYTPYIYTAGAWHIFGGFASGVNATAIQGVPVSATPPTPAQVLQYNSTNGDWEPTNPAAGSVPTLVQNACVAVASHATGITLPAAPTQGNLLIALVDDIALAPSPNTGWVMSQSASAAQDGYGVFWKTAGASEPALQQPCSDTHAGTISMFELANAASGAITAVTGFGSTPNITENAFNQKPSAALIVGCFVVRNTVNTTSITGTGVTRDAQTTGQGRGVDNFHITNPVQLNNAVTANYAANQGGVFMAWAVG